MPLASDIECTEIGTSTNIQDALVELQTKFDDLLSSLPCQMVAENVSYNSISGHTNIRDALDYIFDNI